MIHLFSAFHRAFAAGLKRAEVSLHEEALPFFEKASRLRPSDPRPHLRLGLALSELGRYDSARAALERAIALDKASAVPPLFLGVIHLDHRALDAARESFERARSLDGSNALVRCFGALARWSETEGGAAAPMTLADTDFVQTPPFEARLLLQVEERIAARGEGPAHGTLAAWEVSDNGASRLARFRARKAGKRLRRAARESDRGRHERALFELEAAERCAALDPALQAEADRVRRRCLKSLSREMKDGADRDAKKRFLAGCFAAQLQESARARKFFGEWLDLVEGEAAPAPGLWEMQTARRARCEAALMEGHEGEAAECLERLVELDRHDPYLPYLEGRLALLRGERDKARRAFERFLQREPAFARIRLRELGMRAGPRPQ